MNLRKLAKEIKGLLKDGICNIVIYKVNNSWLYDEVWSFEWDIDYDEELKIKEAMSKDKKAILVNGYDNFIDYTLDYIQYQIKKHYYNEYNEGSTWREKPVKEEKERIKVRYQLNVVTGFGKHETLNTYDSQEEAETEYWNIKSEGKTANIKYIWDIKEGCKYGFKTINGWHDGILKFITPDDYYTDIWHIGYSNGIKGSYQISADEINEIIRI